MRAQQLGLEDHVTCIEQVPVVVQQPVLGIHPAVEGRVRVWGENVIRRSFHSLFDGPLHGALENIRPVVIHAEHEAAIDHHAQVM